MHLIKEISVIKKQSLIYFVVSLQFKQLKLKKILY